MSVTSMTNAILEAHNTGKKNVGEALNSNYFRDLPVEQQRDIVRNLATTGMQDVKEKSLADKARKALKEGVGVGIGMTAMPLLMSAGAAFASQKGDKFGTRLIGRKVLNSLPGLGAIAGIATTAGVASSLLNQSNKVKHDNKVLKAVREIKSRGTKDSDIDMFMLTGHLPNYKKTDYSKDIVKHLDVKDATSEMFVKDADVADAANHFNNSQQVLKTMRDNGEQDHPDYAKIQRSAEESKTFYVRNTQ